MLNAGEKERNEKKTKEKEKKVYGVTFLLLQETKIL